MPVEQYLPILHAIHHAICGARHDSAVQRRNSNHLSCLRTRCDILSEVLDPDQDGIEVRGGQRGRAVEGYDRFVGNQGWSDSATFAYQVNMLLRYSYGVI